MIREGVIRTISRDIRKGVAIFKCPTNRQALYLVEFEIIN